MIALVADMLMRLTLFGGGRNRENNNWADRVVVGIAATILAPIGASLLQMSLSRRREYLADDRRRDHRRRRGPRARARKLRDDTTPLQNVTRATAHLYIESPLRDHKGLRSSLGGMFDTHPPLEEPDRPARAGGRVHAAGANTGAAPAVVPGSGFSLTRSAAAAATDAGSG